MLLRRLYLTATAALLLAACSPHESDTPDSLTKDPARLRTVLRECREQGTGADPKRCTVANQALRERFHRHGPAVSPQSGAGATSSAEAAGNE